MQDLRGIYQAISSGEASWADYVAKPETKPTSDLNDLLGKKPSVEPEVITPEPTQPQPERKRHAQAELEDMRAVLVQEIDEAGLNLKDVEAEAGEFSNRWTASVMDKIRSKIIPNIKAELAGA